MNIPSRSCAPAPLIAIAAALAQQEPRHVTKQGICDGSDSQSLWNGGFSFQSPKSLPDGRGIAEELLSLWLGVLYEIGLPTATEHHDIDAQNFSKAVAPVQ